MSISLPLIAPLRNLAFLVTTEKEAAWVWAMPCFGTVTHTYSEMFSQSHPGKEQAISLHSVVVLDYFKQVTSYGKWGC